ncbi:hypothetical protein GCM10027084_07150 [Pseudoxanthomonas sangjuensis]|uniref:UDP-N-acetylglucosamine 2-epimerase n=1 Tax=Pseudoxanthomonas sangjuensis TaxID=1503750 RepID=UPI001390EA09|nr:UDP-N-acetylglucosamine 2-epimerase [Pseudoxanthomonas sangjuensis]KAF1714112.1 hypothetical protein CSC71_05200 [Pseudoxanthomonas sangjuensis]
MRDPKLIAASAIALAVTLFAIFSIRPWARTIGLIDRPGNRKQHRGRIPLVGGLCFFLGTLVGLTYLGYLDRFVTSLMAGAVVIVVAGVFDDAHDLSVRARLFIEGGATLLVVALSGIYVRNLGDFAVVGDPFGLGPFAIPFTVVAVVGLINAFNMLDGIDGLAATVAMICIGAILLFDERHSAPSVLFLLQVLFAALIPYLCVNLGWPDGRKIFMGDAGSTLIGFLLAWSLIYLSHPRVARMAPVDVMWCVAVPVMDTLSVMYRRLRNGGSPFRADRQHLHHLLLDAGLSPRVTLLCIALLCGALALLGYGMRKLPEPSRATAFLACLVAYVLWLSPMLARRRRAATAPGADGEATEPAAPLAEDLAAVDGAAPHAPVKALCVLADGRDAHQLAPIAQRLARDARFESTLCVAQAAERTTARVLDAFDLVADIEVPSQPSGQSGTQAMPLDGLQRVMGDVRPDLVLVPGDTDATLTTALAAHYSQVPVVCVDAAHARDEPGRRIARALAALHVAPDESTSQRLIDEGVPADRVLVAGDPVDDGGACTRIVDALACLRPADQALLAPARGAGAPNPGRAGMWEAS